MRHSGRRSARARRQPTPWPLRWTGAAGALVAAALTVSAQAWAQNESAPPGPGEAPAREETESGDAAKPSPAVDSQVHPDDERLDDIVLPAAAAEKDLGDDDPLDQLEPWNEGAFLYPYPPAKESLPTPKPPKPAPRHRQAPKTERRWYGWQTLLTDGTSAFTLYVAADSVDDDATQQTLVEIAVLGYLAGAPVVHWANGQTGIGFASLAMRTTSAVAFLFGALDTADDDPAAGALLVIGITGLIAAIPIDAAALARKDVPRRHRHHSQQRPFDFELASITPIVNPANGGIGLSASGRF